MKALREAIRKAFTRRIWVKQGKRRELKMEEVPPNEQIILLVEFSMISIGVLAALEVAHLAFLGIWNSEIFAAITGLIGTITGIFVGAKT